MLLTKQTSIFTRLMNGKAGYLRRVANLLIVYFHPGACNRSIYTEDIRGKIPYTQPFRS